MQKFNQTVQKFGTAPVFFTAISTILGAVMFLRFGFAVGTVGLIGTVMLVLIGHAVTIPTAMAIAEIATNQKVEGGGEYYIISRSFGFVIGGAIGIGLYLSQAISVAFYIIAFTEAFSSLFAWIVDTLHPPTWLTWLLLQKQTIGVPTLFILTFIMLTKGAELGVKMLYWVVGILGISLLAFFIGQTEYSQTHNLNPIATIYNTEAENGAVEINEMLPQPLADTSSMLSNAPVGEINESEEEPSSPLLPIGFFVVFAIIFPAFTGMTAGVGLSGDLRDPGKSIPLGSLAATVAGLVIYLLIAWKLAASASPQDLANTNNLVMADIAWQGWIIIPVGLAAATISSALGSIMVAPRTLQAIARDSILPSTALNRWLSLGRGDKDEPYNASVLTVGVALIFILLGALDMVAEVVSMFFMVTYGSLCLISFLSHFAADPSYRPKFRSRWYFSLFGAVASFGLMFFMNSLYAVVAILMMVGLYFMISIYNHDKRSVALIFQGVIFQFSRQLQVFLQKADKEQARTWRPSVVAMSQDSFTRIGIFELLRWISQKYGFGTYIHLIEEHVSKQSIQHSKECQDRLIQMAEISDSKIYVDTIICPSTTAAFAQVIQLPGIAGTENNLMLLEFSKQQPDSLEEISDNLKLIQTAGFDVIILGTSEIGFRLRRQIHIWITSKDYENANLMILLAYIILGHKDWNKAEIKIFAIHPEDSIESEYNRLLMLIEAGQLPISPNNIEFITRKMDVDPATVINEKSRDADLTIVGFQEKTIKHVGVEVFKKYDAIGNVLFVHSSDEKVIK